MRLNLVQDLVNIATEKINTISPGKVCGKTADEILMVYANIMRRLPRIGKWQVRWSKELLEKDLDPAMKQGIAALELEAKEGRSLWPRLSENILDPAYRDLMLNDWNIHHFHLGLEIDRHLSSGFTDFRKRTDEIALAITQHNSMHLYLIDVQTHGCGFANETTIYIIENNWPELIEPVVLYGAKKHEEEDVNLQRLRESGVNTFIKTPQGHVIAPLGGGVTTNKASVRDRLLVDKIKHELKMIETHLLSELKYNDHLNENTVFRLKMLEDKLIVVEEISGVVYCERAMPEWQV